MGLKGTSVLNHFCSQFFMVRELRDEDDSLSSGHTGDVLKAELPNGDFLDQLEVHNGDCRRAPSPRLLSQPSLCVLRTSGRSSMRNLSVLKSWSQGATLVSEGWERIQMLPSSPGQLVSPQDFYLFVNKYQTRPELLPAS